MNDSMRSAVSRARLAGLFAALLLAALLASCRWP